jgi:serine protease inhibitor
MPKVSVDSSDSVGLSITDSLHTFGMALLQRQCALRTRQNVFIFPLSIFLSLSMMENGARGKTKTALLKALGMPSDISEQTIKDSIVLLMKRLRQQKGAADLEIANALWASTEFTIASEFVCACQEIYDAAIRTLDFSQPSAAAAINEWVAQKSEGKDSPNRDAV